METCCKGQLVRTFYHRTKGRFTAEDEKGNCLSKYRGREDDVKGKDAQQEVRWEYYLDHSMIEAYLNEQKLMTLRNYTEGTERLIRLAETKGRLIRLALWEMEAAY